METWTISYTGAETVNGMKSFEDCLDAIQRRFSDREQLIDRRRPRREIDTPSLAAWEFFDESNGDVLAKLYCDN